MVAQSGGEVNRRLDRRLVECLPATDAAHGDLPRGHQGPEQHGRRFRVGQGALGLHPALELPDRRSLNVVSKAGNGIEADAPKIDSPHKSSKR